MGHLGLTPQSIYKFGTYVVRAKEEEEAKRLLEDAHILAESGCFALVLEKIPAKLAEKVAQEVKIPIIGIQLLYWTSFFSIVTKYLSSKFRYYAKI